jgi:hypothetical protein
MQNNLCQEIIPEPIMILQTLDEYLQTETLQKGMANVSVIMRNISNFDFVPTSVVRTFLRKENRDEIVEWCEQSLSGNCRMEFVNAKIYFELEDDALLFILRWKGEDVCHSFM